MQCTCANALLVPCPRDLLVEKQLQRSLVISWSPPQQSLVPVTQYHVCVDSNVKAVVPGGYKTKALIEDIELTGVHKVSVRAVTDKGHSSDAACTVTVGNGNSCVRGCVRTHLCVQLLPWRRRK
jgi:RIMS-binding protein 2